MGLFDKIKDNAKNISIKALDVDKNENEADSRFEYLPTKEPALATASVQATVISPTTDKTQTEDEPKDEDKPSPKPKTEKTTEKDGKDDSDSKSEDKETKKPRKSKVIEISKAEHERMEKKKLQSKAKQEAKERLAKSYTPSYKAATKKSKGTEAKSAKSESESSVKEIVRKKATGIIDIAPHKLRSTAKGAAYARERAAMSVLASQRKLNGTVPLYMSNHMNFKTKVFINRIEYSGSFGKTSIPIEKVAWIKLRFSGTGIIIETTEGKRVVMVVKPVDRLDFANAVLKVQSMQPKKSKFKDTKTVRIDHLEKISESVDEIEKLAKLYDKGILTQEEFETKKKQILGI